MTAASRVLRHTWTTWTTVARVAPLPMLLVPTLGLLAVSLPTAAQPALVRDAPAWVIAVALLAPVTGLLQVQLPVDTLPVRRAEADRGELLAFALPCWALIALASPWLAPHTALVCALAVASWVAPLLGGRTATALLPATVGAVGTGWSHRPVLGLLCTVMIGLVHAAWWSSKSIREQLDDRHAPLDAATRDEDRFDVADSLGLRLGTVPHGPREVLVEIGRRLPLRLLGLGALGLLFAAIGWVYSEEVRSKDLPMLAMFSLWILFGGSTFSGAGRSTMASVIHLPIPQRMILVDGLLRVAAAAVFGAVLCLVARDDVVVIVVCVFLLAWTHSVFTDHAPHAPSLKALRLTGRSVALALAAPATLYVATFAALALGLPLRGAFVTTLLLVGAVWLLTIVRPVWRLTPT